MNYRILVVDDELEKTETFKIGLESKGFIVETYNDPLLALSSFRPKSYDILLLDIGMPELNGFDLYKILRDIDYNIKVCFVTSFEPHFGEFKHTFPELRSERFVRIPITIDDLVNVIKDCLVKTNEEKFFFILNKIRNYGSVDA